ncbi:transmembrane channel-like protein 7 [Amphiura filiformis]|uniref:transmembrane channel-like protein 7 n=1 Tax=Amphiura filiformis TaxID=82378 RepID=UPI003B2153E1
MAEPPSESPVYDDKTNLIHQNHDTSGVYAEVPITADLYGNSVNHEPNLSYNNSVSGYSAEIPGEVRHRASLNNMDPTGSNPASEHELSPGRSLNNRPGSSFHRAHMDTAMEYELDKLQNDKSEGAEENRSKLIRSMPTTMHRKREIRNKYGSKKLKAVSGWKTFKYSVALKWKHFKEKSYDFLLWFEVWRSSLKEVEGKFGTAVVSYFVFLKFLLFLNIYIFILMLGFVALPQWLLGNGYTYQDQTLSCEENYYESISKDCLGDSEAEPPIDQQIDQCFFDVLEGTREDNFIPIDKNIYDLPLAYLLTTIVYFVLSLILMVNYTAKGFKENLTNREDHHYKHCNKVFASWDFSLTDSNNSYLKHKSIHYELASDLEEERQALKRKTRTKFKKCQLYFLRVFLNLIVLIILGGSFYLIYFTTDFAVLNSTSALSNNNFVDLLISFLPSITITILNGVVPMIFNVIVRFEDYSPQFEITITLVRTVFLRLASLGILFFSLFPQIVCPNQADDCGVCETGNLQCWETYIGQEFYKLSITDFAATTVVVLLWEFPRKLAAKYLKIGIAKALGNMEFEIPKNVLAIVYSQALCWIGSFYAPLLPVVCVIKCFVFFYLKKWSLLYNMVPSSRPFRASRSGIFFMAILLVTFMLCIIPVGYSIAAIAPSQGCGPFRGRETIWSVMTETVDSFPAVLNKAIDFIASAAFVIPLIVVLFLTLYYYHAIASAHKQMVNILKEQLIMEGRDKHFLLTRLNELEPNIKGGHQKHKREQAQSLKQSHHPRKQQTPPPRAPSEAWSGRGSQRNGHPFSTSDVQVW